MTSNDQRTKLEVTLNSSTSILVGVQFQEKNQVSFLFEFPFEGTVVWFIVKELTTLDGRHLHRMIGSLSHYEQVFLHPMWLFWMYVYVHLYIYSYISILYNIAHICSYHIYICQFTTHNMSLSKKSSPCGPPDATRWQVPRPVTWWCRCHGDRGNGSDQMGKIPTKGGVVKASWDSFLLKNGI